MNLLVYDDLAHVIDLGQKLDHSVTRSVLSPCAHTGLRLSRTIWLLGKLPLGGLGPGIRRKEKNGMPKKKIRVQVSVDFQYLF